MESLNKFAAPLREMGFSKEEIAHYLKLTDAGECSCPERLRMLCEKRRKMLDKIHRLEEQIARMDLMMHEIRKNL